MPRSTGSGSPFQRVFEPPSADAGPDHEWCIDQTYTIHGSSVSSPPCTDVEYREWVRGLQRDGFEIGWHNATFHSSPREQTLRGLETFAGYFGYGADAEKLRFDVPLPHLSPPVGLCCGGLRKPSALPMPPIACESYEATMPFAYIYVASPSALRWRQWLRQSSWILET